MEFVKFVLVVFFSLKTTGTVIVNIARGKPVNSSGVSHGGYPDRITDGKINNGNWDPSSCAFTKDTASWFKVDLQKTASIYKIQLIGRRDCCPYQSQGWTIRIGLSGTTSDPICKQSIDASGGSVKNVFCLTSLTGRYITIWGSREMVLCEILAFETGCKFTVQGKDYRGSVSETKTGRKCQAWSSQSPHVHFATPSNRPNSGLDQNFCRNPDNEPDGPWCYTVDKSKRWEYCNVPKCPSCKSTVLGKDYRGSVSITKTGKKCQAWSSQSPHSHTENSSKYPNSGLDQNFCRNPDNQTDGPWCYTVDKNTRWEYCDVPQCPSCKFTVQGKEYRGNVSVTKTGKKCQVWSSQSPHSHISTPKLYPKSGMDQNFCRNPDNADSEPNGPWCYTVDKNTRWEYCDVPKCTISSQTSSPTSSPIWLSGSNTSSGKYVFILLLSFTLWFIEFPEN